MSDSVRVTNMNFGETHINNRIFTSDVSVQAKYLYCVLKYHAFLHGGKHGVTELFLKNHMCCDNLDLIKGWFKELSDNKFISDHASRTASQEEEEGAENGNF